MPKGRALKRMKYTRRFVNVTMTGGKRKAPVEYKVTPPEQCRPGWKGEVLDKPMITVEGSYVIQCYCPASGKSLGRIIPSTRAGIDRAVQRARAAQVEWAKTCFSERRRVLKTLLKFILDNQETIVTAACLDSGKTRLDALLGEILMTTERIKWTLDHGEKVLRPDPRPTNLIMMYKSNEVRWEPLGVVAACVSWKYFHNLLGPIVSSLFAGNAIIVKPSEQTAWSSAYFAQIVQSALVVCGHSPHLAQSLVCWPHVADHLTSHSGISHLTFIGSRHVARAVAASAAKALTPTVLELGGKDAALVLDSTPKSDIPRVASVLMRGVFQSAGQNCIGIERIIATPGVYDDLVAALTPRVRALRVGSALDDDDDEGGPVDVGACASPARFAELMELILDAVAEGAQLLAGGTRVPHPRLPRGCFFAPTLLAGVTPRMRIARAELFAPVALVMAAADAADAVRVANGTPFALGASVFGGDVGAGPRGGDVERAVRGLRVGMVAVNDFAAYYAVSLPFGGRDGSGHGRFAGAEGLRGLCCAKSVCRDALWARVLGVKTAIPRALDYPVDGGVAYGVGWGVRWRGLRRLMDGGRKEQGEGRR
ncbi:Aldehyde/histidinol dehydrogenase [Lineolata rhizophorae]|uniref:aldehyde dehydrogenase (NAD(+)) n=1 Tax=Lineolata rhizophorae TaxID=578093 RepID=A0A6A6P3A1_9PEZI|nr:Aldehyde/histidinol dehydrogenase [Lineolata rhizophorae]